MSTASALLTPTDLSPARSFDIKLHSPYELHAPSLSSFTYNSIPNINHHNNSLLFEQSSSIRSHEHQLHSPQSPSHRSLVQPQSLQPQSLYQSADNSFPIFEPFNERRTPAPISPQFQSHFQSPPHQSYYTTTRTDVRGDPPMSWRQLLPTPPEWLRPEDKLVPSTPEYGRGRSVVGTKSGTEDPLRMSPSGNSSFEQHVPTPNPSTHAHEVSRRRLRQNSQSLYAYMRCILFSKPINFLSLLHPSSSPPYHVFVARIIKSSDQQASIFLQQKLKVAESDERAKIVDAICARGFEMMAHR